VDSRRWEAFSEGIDDFNLFKELNNNQNLSQTQKDKINTLTNQKVVGSQIQDYRIELLTPFVP
jgi:hypothetical protein